MHEKMPCEVAKRDISADIRKPLFKVMRGHGARRARYTLYERMFDARGGSRVNHG